MANHDRNLDFLISATCNDSKIFPNVKIEKWIKERQNSIKYKISKVPLEALKLWSLDKEFGNIKNISGGFFSVDGIRVETNWGNNNLWDQPIINQPEIGLLGFISKKINGILHLLVQAKIEPGNLNVVQLSPTLQATKSNYTMLHKGKKPKYLEYFNGENKVTVLLDQLQSEQGARFLRKRNRNIIVELDESENLDQDENFIWLTIGQIKRLLKKNNVVNMDTRTVISGISYGSYSQDSLNLCFSLMKNKNIDERMLRSALNVENSFNSFKKIISWITEIKSKYELNIVKKPLNKLDEWEQINGEIKRKDNKYFSVIGIDVSINNREVKSWDQPMIKSSQEGIIAFIIKPINGIYHFLVQAKIEAGNFDIVELAPTVQCLTGNYRDGENEYKVPFLNEIINASNDSILYDSMQSEEGGRFYKEQNRNLILNLGENFPTDLPENYIWMTLNQLLKLIEFNNYLNISARSLISVINFE